MILAGVTLLGIGGADLVRRFVHARRWIGYLVLLVVLIALAVAGGAVAAAIVAPVLTVAWMFAMPLQPTSPRAFWPAVALAAVCVASIVLVGAGTSRGMIAEVWDVRSPSGPVSFDLAVLTVGVVAFQLESANLVVRSALTGEHVWRPEEDRESRSGFAGGRLIGPLERILVFLLTLVPAYPLLAAMLAAKGIVRFPEISRGGETGARAEYFLVGSMVSWVCALAGALAVWWAANI